MSPRLRFTTTTLSTRDPRRLAAFYAALLGWEHRNEDDGWVVLRAVGDTDRSGHALAFHGDDQYVPPVWPSRAGQQLMMAHIEIGTDDVAAAVEHARACGASVAPHQPQDDVRVMFDPDGHPFCLFRDDRVEDDQL
jgi:catechol 2,3-dioxygenase-like lactoylglutathione lyase family enzyme